MFLILEVPRFLTSPQLTKLIRQDRMSVLELQILEYGQKIREDLVKENDLIRGNPDKYNQFVHTQAQINNILSSRPAYTPQYSYSSFVSEIPVLIQTGQYTPHEACEIDLIMTKYYVLMSSMHQCISYLGKLREISLQTKPTMEETDLIANQCLMILTTSYEDFMQLYKSANDLLKHISCNKSNQYVDIMPQVFQSIKLLHEINVNEIYVIKLLTRLQYDEIQQISFTACKKLEKVQEQLKDLQKQINPRILGFCELSLIYHRQMVYFAIIKQNEKLIKKEDFSDKKGKYHKKLKLDFYVLTTEVLNLAQEILILKDHFPENMDEDFYDYFVQFYKSVLEPAANSVLKTYTGILKRQILVQSNQELFESTTTLDYFQ